MKIISLKLPDELDNSLNAVTKKRHINKSTLIREIIAEYLAAPQIIKNASFLERTKNLCGSLTGPSDLSTNKKHMENFGNETKNYC